MKSLKITLATFAVLVVLSDARGQVTLKKLLQNDLDVSQNPIDYGFPNCNFTFPPGTTPPGGNPPGSNPECPCSLTNGTGAGLPSMGQATYTSYSQNALVSTGAAANQLPDNLHNTTVAVEVCSCQNKVFSSARSLVKTNNFVFGGRIDVA